MANSFGVEEELLAASMAHIREARQNPADPQPDPRKKTGRCAGLCAGKAKPFQSLTIDVRRN